MSGYKDQTIIETIREINKSYFLPSIQRKFVWDTEQIEKLFDSIMRDYPIGTFLFWEVEKGDDPSHIDDYTFYKFIEDYNEKAGDEFLQDKLNKPSGLPKIIAVLDGQQRLSSLFCALRGSYAMKVNKKLSPYDPYPKKELYFNLHYKPDDENSCMYKFSFLLENQAKSNWDGGCWLKVKDVLSWTESKDKELTVWEKAKGISRNVKEKFADVSDEDCDKISIAIVRLWKKLVSEDLITYYKIDRSELDDILDIFVRVNSAGTPLSRSDLVFSTIVASWEDGREKIENLINLLNEKGDHFKFDKDFIVTLCLALMDFRQKFETKTFNNKNIEKVKKSWNAIVAAISEAVDLLVEFGFNDENLTAYYIVIPVAYYLFKSKKKIKDLSKDDKSNIRKFLIYGMSKKIFSGGVDSVLTTLLAVLKQEVPSADGTSKDYILKCNDYFDLDGLKEVQIQGKSLMLTVADLDDLLEIKKGPITFMLLSLLYPNIKFKGNKWHQDHIHPKTLFDKNKLSKYLLAKGAPYDTKKLLDWKDKSNTIVNLQLLPGEINQEKGKMELSKWIYKEFTDTPAIHHYAEENYLDENVGYELVDFNLFYIKRREKIREKLIKLLDISIDDNVDGGDGNINENERTTLANTIFNVLKQHPEGMTIQEIYDEIIKHNLYEFGAENPKGVTYITIQRRCIGSEISKQNSIKLFKIIQVVDKNIYYGIVDSDDSIIT